MPKVLIPLAAGFEELEAITIIDLLRRANFEVITAGLTEGAIQASRKTVVIPDMTLEQALNDSYDLVVLPGGQPGSTHLEKDARIIALLQKTAANNYVAAICAAPKVLATAGLLDNKKATAYPGTLDTLAKAGKLTLVSDNTVVIDNNIITSRGPGTAMDFALTLIALLADDSVREKVEAGLVR